MNGLKKMTWLLLLMAGTSLLFTACEKEDSLLETNADTPSTNIDNGSQAPSIAAAMGKGTASDTTELDECDCFALFDNIDWESEDWEVIEEQVDAVLEALSDEEIDALFTPVCVGDEVFPNACIADCNNITGYEACPEEDYWEDDDEWEDEWDDEEWEHEDEWDDCEDWFEDITFPYEITFPDCSTVTVNDEEEYFEAIDEWFIANEPSINYPITLVFNDGNTNTVNSEEELETAIDAFFEVLEESIETEEDWEALEDEELVTVQYPISLTMPDGSVVTVNSDEEWDALYEDLEEGDCADDFWEGKVSGHKQLHSFQKASLVHEAVKDQQKN